MLTNDSVPFINTDQMIEVDRAMIEDYQILLIQMMENAGRNLAILARQRFFSANLVGKRIAVMAGSGGNGGGALVAARYLHNWGADVYVFLSSPVESMTAIPRHQLNILRRMNIQGTNAVAEEININACFDLIIDGLIGFSLKGAPRGPAATFIHWANLQSTATLALDTPSGIDASTGVIYEPAIKAVVTMTLALPKTGLQAPDVKQHIGELYLADIGVPPELYASSKLNLKVGRLFTQQDIIRLW